MVTEIQRIEQLRREALKKARNYQDTGRGGMARIEAAKARKYQEILDNKQLGIRENTKTQYSDYTAAQAQQAAILGAKTGARTRSLRQAEARRPFTQVVTLGWDGTITSTVKKGRKTTTTIIPSNKAFFVAAKGEKQLVVQSVKRQGIQKVFTQSQLNQVRRSQYLSSVAYNNFVGEIKKIDRQSNLNAIQKEEKKRELANKYGIVVSSGNGKGFGDKLKSDKMKRNKELANLLDKKGLDKKVQNAALGINLSKQQHENLVAFVTSPFKYGQSLSKRYQKGENALYNDLKSFSRGVGIALKEMFVDPVVTAFNYGRRIQREAMKGNFVIDDDLRKLYSGAKTAAGAAKWAARNPVQAGIIVGAVATQIGGVTKASYKKNPAQFMGKAVAYLFPTTIIKGIGQGSVRVFSTLKSIKTKRTKELEQIIKSIAALEKKGIKATSRGIEGQKLRILKEQKKIITTDLNELISILSKSLEKKLKTLTVKKDIAKIDKRVNKITKKVNKSSEKLKKNKKKISDLKKAKGLNNLYKSKKNTKLKTNEITEGLNSLFRVEGKVVKLPLKPDVAFLERKLIEARKISGAVFSKLKKKIKKEYGLNVVQRTKNGKVTYKLLPPKSKIPLKRTIKVKKINLQGKRKNVRDVSSKGVDVSELAPKPIKITKAQSRKATKRIVEQTNKVRKLRQKDKQLLEGLDNLFPKGRTSQNDYKKFNTIVNEYKGSIDSFGKKGQQQFKIKFRRNFKQGYKNLREDIGDIKQNYINYVRNTKKRKPINTTKGKNMNLPKEKRRIKVKSRSEIKQKIVSANKKIFETKKLLKVAQSLKLLTALEYKQSLANLQKLEQNLKFKFDFDKLPKKPSTPPPKKPINKLSNKEIIIKPKIPRKSKRINKPQITKPKKLKIPKKPSTPPPKKRKLKLDLDFKTRLKRGEGLAFNILYRRKGKVVTRNVQLPQNKALQEAVRLIKRTPSRSMELKIAGVTSRKDIRKPNLKDFKLRKTKKALLLVEVPKSAAKGLKGTRRRK